MILNEMAVLHLRLFWHTSLAPESLMKWLCLDDPRCPHSLALSMPVSVEKPGNLSASPYIRCRETQTGSQ